MVDRLQLQGLKCKVKVVPSRRDNLRFDGIEEWEDESWTDTEENLKLQIKETLGIVNIEFERAHRVGDKNQSSCRTIVAKLSKYKTKEHILTQK